MLKAKVEKAATALGWLFVLATGMILMKPGGAASEQLRALRTNWKVERVASKNFAEIAASPDRLGTPAADRLIVEFMDYQCYYCRIFDETAKAFVAERLDAAVVIRHLPRPGDGASREAAFAAICAGEQDRFPQFHHHLLTDTTWTRSRDWNEVARRIEGIDPQALEACMVSPEAAQRFKQDSTWAASLALNATPTLLTIRGGVARGAVPRSALESWTDTK